MAIDELEYPETLELRFRTKEEKEEFIAQFLDGWGENLPISKYFDLDGNSIDQIAVELDDEDL